MRTWLERTTVVPGGRRGKWLVLAVWLLAAMALGSLAGKLGDVQDTTANAFLPRGAESAQVNTELERFRTHDLTPAVVVYTGDAPSPTPPARPSRATARPSRRSPSRVRCRPRWPPRTAGP